MKKWTVYTPDGDYCDIYAPTASAAMRQVERMTLGRAKPYMAREVPNA